MTFRIWRESMLVSAAFPAESQPLAQRSARGDNPREGTLLAAWTMGRGGEEKEKEAGSRELRRRAREGALMGG